GSGCTTQTPAAEGVFRRGQGGFASLVAALAAGRPISTHRHGVPRQAARLFHQPEGSPSGASPAHRGYDGGWGRILGGRAADFGTVQANKTNDSPLAMALEAALIGL